VTYRPVARQRPRNNQRVQPLLCNRRIDEEPYLSSGSVVTTFPQKRTRTQQWSYGGNGVFSMWSVPGVKKKATGAVQFSWEFVLPCGGGVEYLHRDPASRRRRRKEKSQIWDSKIRSRVPRALVREGASQKQDLNCQIVIYIWSWAPDGARHKDLLTDWPSVAMWLRLRLRVENCQFSVQLSSAREAEKRWRYSW
jgi:hypothetical protein